MKINGVYIKVTDRTNKDYVSYGIKNGKINKFKYTLKDKIIEMLKYGKTKHMQYSYILFYKLPYLEASGGKLIENINEEINLYMGIMIGELTNILQSLKNIPFETNSADKYSLPINYYNENNKVIITNRPKDGQNAIITFNKDETTLFYNFISIITNEEMTEKYEFYQWNRPF